MRTLGFLILLAAAACGGGSGTGDDQPDAPNATPTTVTVSGNASSVSISGKQGEADVLVAAYANSDENTIVAMTTTDASGNYSLMITTTGPLDGYLKATKSGFKETYLYPPAPLAADFANASINMVTPGSYNLLYSLTQVSQQAGMATVAMIVSDGTNSIAGATVSSTPAGTARYNGTNGLPANMNNAMMTQMDGIGYLLNVAPGEVTVAASKSGLTFKSHAIKARADQLTTTLVVE